MNLGFEVTPLSVALFVIVVLFIVIIVMAATGSSEGYVPFDYGMRQRTQALRDDLGAYNVSLARQREMDYDASAPEGLTTGRGEPPAFWLDGRHNIEGRRGHTGAVSEYRESTESMGNRSKDESQLEAALQGM